MIRIPTTTVCRSHAAFAPRIAVAQTKRKLHLFLRHAARPALVAVHPLPRRRLLARAYSSSTEWRSTGAGPTGVGPTDARPGGEGGRDGGGSPPLPASGSPAGVWPAPADQIEAARALIAEAAASPSDVLLVPYRDADGLAAGAIVSLTLQLLGKPAGQICTHFAAAGNSISDEGDALSQVCRDRGVSHVLVLNQGSPPLVGAPGIGVLVIDHHRATVFPQGAVVVSACGHRPVAPSSLLSYVICRPLHDHVAARASWIALLGVFGNLGSRAPLGPPYPPELLHARQDYRTAHLSNLVSLLNAPRRTPECSTVDAWNLLHHSPDADPPPTPERIVQGAVNGPLLDRLLDAKRRVKEELDRWKRSRPVFSLDGRVAVIYLESAYQIHPLIATWWGSFLVAKNLDFVMVANGGYVDGRVDFSCRVVKAKCVPGGRCGVYGGSDIAAALRDYAAVEPWVAGLAGPDFANGHRQSATGSLPTAVWTAFAEHCLMLKPYTPDELRAKNDKRRSKKRDREQAKDQGPAAQQQDTLDSKVVRKQPGPEE